MNERAEYILDRQEEEDLAATRSEEELRRKIGREFSNAAAVLQRANLSLEQRVRVQKSLAAQLRQLLRQETPPPAAQPDPKRQIPDNPILKLFL